MNKKIKVLAGIVGLGSTALINNAFATPQTFLGNVVADGPYGNIQVQITVDGGKITDITTPVQPTGQSAAYASFAIPTLVTEALAAQSANINAVSGASYISTAWKSSLASAIANAGSSFGVQAPPTPTPTTPAPTQTPVAPTVNLNGNTSCVTAAPTPVSTTSSTTTNTVPDPSTPTPTITPSRTPTPIPTERENVPTPTPTKIISQDAESIGGDNLRVTTVLAGANATTITIVKTITQNQVITCTTVNTVTNTVTVPGPTQYINIPGPTVTVTAVPTISAPPVIVVGVPDHPVIIKKPVVNNKHVIKTKFNPYKITVIKCKSGKFIKVIAKNNPSCPVGYKKIK